MADEPDLTEITIRQKGTGLGERSVTKYAFDAGFFPDYERVDTKGRVVAPSTPKES